MTPVGSMDTRDRPDEPAELAQQLSDFARRLEARRDPEAILEEIVQAAVALVPGAQEGSISTVKGRRHVTSRHPSGRLPELVDAAQMETGQGPCLDAAYEHRTVQVPDLTHEKRWPEFSARAVAAGAASMLCFQLFVEHNTLGALNLYSREVDSFDDDSEHIGLLFASHAAIAYADAEKIRNLRIAVDSRDLIGQAKGILMERFKITAGQAFDVLAKVSQDTNRKVYAVAEDLTRTGTLDR